MRLRFTIRDLLWLLVVAALCAAWWTDHRNVRREQAEMYRTQLNKYYELFNQYEASERLNDPYPQGPSVER